MEYENPINMKFKEISLLSTKEINDLGYIPLWVQIRSRHDEKRKTKKFEIPKEISGDKSDKAPTFMSEFHVIAKGVDCHRFALNPKDGIEKLQKYLKETFPQWSFYVLKFGVKQKSTNDIIVWKRELVAPKSSGLPLEDRKGLGIFSINDKKRDKPGGPKEKDLWKAGGDQPKGTGGRNGNGGMAEEYCIMSIEEGIKYSPTCILPT